MAFYMVNHINIYEFNFKIKLIHVVIRQKYMINLLKYLVKNTWHMRNQSILKKL